MLKTLAPSVTARDPKGLKFISVVGAAYDKAGLSEDEAQRINDTPGLPKLVADFIAENRLTDKYKGEEVKSNYTYPPEYTGPKPIREQIAAVAQIFGLDPSAALTFIETLPKEFPEGANGWFAVPSIEAVARVHFADITDPAEAYCAVVRFVHEKVAATRPFYNYREGQITPAHLRRHARTVEYLAKLAESQPGDILVVAAQLGRRHKGRSTRRAREVFTAGEFGLGSFEVGAIVLTHPERLVRWEQLHMDCPGDEFAPEAAGGFSRAPGWSFDGGWVKVCTDGVDRPHERFGSASGLLSQ